MSHVCWKLSKWWQSLSFLQASIIPLSEQCSVSDTGLPAACLKLQRFGCLVIWPTLTLAEMFVLRASLACRLTLFVVSRIQASSSEAQLHSVLRLWLFDSLSLTWIWALLNINHDCHHWGLQGNALMLGPKLKSFRIQLDNMRFLCFWPRLGDSQVLAEVQINSGSLPLLGLRIAWVSSGDLEAILETACCICPMKHWEKFNNTEVKYWGEPLGYYNAECA